MDIQVEMSRRQLEICLSLERCIGESLVVFKAIGLDRIPDKKELKQNLMVQPALKGRLQRENPNRRLGRSSQRRGCKQESMELRRQEEVFQKKEIAGEI